MENNSLLRHKEEDNKQFSSLNFTTKDMTDLDIKDYEKIEKQELELMNISRIEEHEVTMLFVLKNLIPNIANYFLIFFTELIEIHFLGQTKDLVIFNGVALGILFNNLFCYLPSFGLSQAISVECSKSFGSKNLTLLGHQANQVRIIIIFFFIIYALINLFFSKPILYLIAGEGKAYVEESSRFVLWTIPAMFFDAQASAYVGFSEAHLNFSPIYITLFVAAVVHCLGCYLTISVYNLGVFGAALSFNITTFVKLATFIICYTIHNPYPESYFFFRKETFNWRSFKRMISVSLGTMVLIVAEFGGNYLIDVLSNRLPELSYSKWIVLDKVVYVLIPFSDAWMTTNTILVGNFIGENSPRKIKLCIKYSFYLTMIIMTPIYVLSFIFRFSIARFFSENETIMSSPDMNTLLIWSIILHVIIISQYFLIGIIRGCELNLLSTIVSVSVFVLFMPSLASILMFVFKLDVLSNIITFLISYTIATLIWSIVLLYVDIQKLCEEYAINNNNNNDMINQIEELEEEDENIKKFK